MPKARIKKIAVTGLQGHFSYEIEFRNDNQNIVLIAPNGYGKTAFLSLINSCLQFKLLSASRIKFDTLTVTFDDKTKWKFERKVEIAQRQSKYDRERKSSRITQIVKVYLIDAKGKESPLLSIPDINSESFESLARVVERSIPSISRVGPNDFRDFRTSEMFDLSQVMERYRETVEGDSEIALYMQRFAPDAFKEQEHRLNCVFIETQRLLLAAKMSAKSGNEGRLEPEEEIVRQVQSLAANLASTHSSYASISQELDRSFPNRLIERATTVSAPPDLERLRSDLEAIESKRKALTEAGILVETTAHVVAPGDKLLPAIGDTLQIYIEDSRKKLSTFDEVYKRVSLFKHLVNKKLWRKSVSVSRDTGISIFSEKERLDITQLSSGEKHEFVMLFRLIFETPENSIVLIDEPEISLHVVWQLEFMSDLREIQSISPFQAIIATHSPQVSQGWDDITFDLDEQVK